MSNAELPDGRLERTVRTRKRLIEAYIGVASEKKRIPTTVEVATRAGVSQRSLFERFGSLGGCAGAPARPGCRYGTLWCARKARRRPWSSASKRCVR